MKVFMRYKCHYCGEFLKPGVNYTLECDCGNCSLGFEKSGKVDSFQVKLFEKGKDLFLVQYKDTNTIYYGYKKFLYLDNKRLSPFQSLVSVSPEIIMQIDANLHFDEGGTPQVYKLWERLDKLKVFS